MLRRRLDDGADRSTWQARDETLERPVRVTVTAAGQPGSAALLDAARRAAGVEDLRLVRVLDVGEDEGRPFVVTEWFQARTLTELVSSGPVPAEEARTLVGEACRALETARHRGLHHLRLRPSLVHRLEDGSVKVEGLATEAALAQFDVQDGDDAARLDTRDLVALGYAALTGYWPIDVDDDERDLPPAPSVSGSVAAPSELVGGVPSDLDTLCAQTFAGDGPPATPGALAAQIAPWGRDRRTSRPDGSFPHSLPPVRLAPRSTPDAGATAVVPVVPTKKAGTAKKAAGTAKKAAEAAKAPPKGSTAAKAPPKGSTVSKALSKGSTPPAEPPSTSEHLTEPDTTVAVPVVGAVSPARPLGPLEDLGRPRDAGPDHRGSDRADRDRGGSGHGSSDRADRDRADRDRSDEGDRDFRRAVLGLGGADDGRGRTGSSVVRAQTDDERRQSRTVLAVVTVFVIAFLLLAWKGLSGLGGAFTPSTTDPPPSAASTSTRPPTPTTATPSPTTPSPTTTARPRPIRVAAASGFDPEGDGAEKDQSAADAVDGDDGTSWTSDRYRSAQFGGLKQGVGLLLDLGVGRTVTTVRVDLGRSTGATVQLRLPNGDQVASRVLAEREDASGTVTLRPDEPLRTDRLVVWFTVPSPTDGGFRAEVAEVTLS